MKIPTILLGDDAAAITVTAPAGAAALTVRVAGVERTFANVAAGAELSLKYTAEETRRMGLGTHPMVFSATAADGDVTTYPLTARLKVTDCAAEVYNAAVSVDALGVAEATAGDSLADVKTKLNAVIRRMGGVASALALAFAWTAEAATLNEISGTNEVYTAAEVRTYVAGHSGGAVTNGLATTNYVDAAVRGAVTTNDVCAIVTNEVGGSTVVGSRFATPVVYSYTFESVDYAITNLAVRWNGEYWEMHVAGWADSQIHHDGWYKCATTNWNDGEPYSTVNSNLNTDAVTVWIGDKTATGFSQNIGDGLRTYVNGTAEYMVSNGTHNALGLAYERDILPTVTGTVTKAYVEALGISGGGGAVASVNGMTGAVVLAAADVGAADASLAETVAAITNFDETVGAWIYTNLGSRVALIDGETPFLTNGLWALKASVTMGTDAGTRTFTQKNRAVTASEEFYVLQYENEDSGASYSLSIRRTKSNGNAYGLVRTNDLAQLSASNSVKWAAQAERTTSLSNYVDATLGEWYVWLTDNATSVYEFRYATNEIWTAHDTMAGGKLDVPGGQAAITGGATMYPSVADGDRVLLTDPDEGETATQWKIYDGHAAATNAAVAVVAEVKNYLTAQTNAYFVVTNYESTAGVPATMQLYEWRDGARRLVWDQRIHTTNEIAKAAAATNALKAEIAAVSNAIPSAAWGARYPTGGENPATNEVWVSTPTTVISGGWEWQKNVTAGGALWLLRSNGIIADLGRGGTTNSAYLKITDWEGNEVLTVTKTSSVMVDALPDSCEWDEMNGYFVVKYFKTDTQPIAYCKADVEDGGATFATAQMEGNAGCAATCTWTANANDWELHATPTNAAMTRLFVAATYERQGSTVIQNNAPIGVMGGMMVTNAAAGGWITVYPKWNGSTVTWGTTR